jgi:hypothetical protein
VAAPDFTVRGDPAAIRERAAITVAKGQSFYDTGDALSTITTEGWTGRAADHFRDAHELEPERWTRAGDGFRSAGAALEVYAGAVEAAQGVAAWARDEYARGDEVTAQARSAYDHDVARARNEVANAAARGETMTLTIHPFDDPGQAVRDQAVAELSAARSTLDAAAQTCADAVRAGCREAPEKPGWLESGLRFVGGIFVGAGEAVWDLLTLSPLSPINMIDDLYSLSTGELTPEELMVKYRLSVETVGDLVQALKDDPVEFGKQLGKGLLDWDTWADDPARAIGHLVPDLIIAIATAGTGEAAVGAEGAVGGLDGVSHLDDLARLDDLAELGRLDDLAELGKLDELGHLGRLDDLGDLGRLDELGDLGDLGKLDDAGGLDFLDDLGDIDALGDLPPELSLDEVKSLNAYSGPLYDDLNAHLRGLGDHGTLSTEQLGQVADEISAGLGKLPEVPGETLRGTNLPDSVLDGIEKGGSFGDPAFFSTSTSETVAQQFRAGGNTMFHVDGTSGHSIGGLSQYAHEAEILFDKGTQFTVVDKVWNPAGYWDIFLKEAP